MRVILGIFSVAILRLAKSAASLFSPLGVAAIFLLAGAAGLFVFHSRKPGAVAIGSVLAILALTPLVRWSTAVPWTLAVLKGMSPAAIGVLGVALFRLAPQARHLGPLVRT